MRACRLAVHVDSVLLVSAGSPVVTFFIPDVANLCLLLFLHQPHYRFINLMDFFQGSTLISPSLFSLLFLLFSVSFISSPYDLIPPICVRFI